ncbi:regulator of microtubule dynamics protein 2 isoform X2 [Sorex araneus]|uniref:regulator of microtubule dynamics protein 2 isoform X2 n=1 Tax=Sorex araneus TaxID=42254 RepID=UPI002433D73A|nr:regulator of microtubule dynamics protein 2 isoform X2 [Sorex araneus]
MPRSTRNELVLGLLVGTAGISLFLWYCRGRRPRASAEPPVRLPPGPTHWPHKPRGGPEVMGVSQGQQLHILDKLDELVTHLEALRAEVRALKEALPRLEEYIQGELGGKASLPRASPQHRARKRRPVPGQQHPATSNSSEEAESEGGYNTANTDTEEQDFPVTKQLNTYIEELSLDDLLRKADHLRTNDSGKKESFELLYYHREKFRDEIEFIWRLARAYGDMCELSTDVGEKKHYANVGKTLGEKAVSQAPTNGYCHLWYAVLCGHVSEFEGLQNKINYGHCFKKHLDKAIEFLPEEPYLYYLRGRYCYAVSRLSWIERRMAATLFGIMPTSTVTEALQDFLKAEELKPGFSKYNYVFLAKCYVDLDSVPEALKFCDLAQLLPCVSRENMRLEQIMRSSCFLPRTQDEEAESQARAMLGSLSKR